MKDYKTTFAVKHVDQIINPKIKAMIEQRIKEQNIIRVKDKHYEGPKADIQKILEEIGELAQDEVDFVEENPKINIFKGGYYGFIEEWK